MRANTAARILYTYFDLPDEIDAGDDKAELSGEFTVTNVNFAYPTRPEHKVYYDVLQTTKTFNSRWQINCASLHQVENQLR